MAKKNQEREEKRVGGGKMVVIEVKEEDKEKVLKS